MLSREALKKGILHALLYPPFVRLRGTCPVPSGIRQVSIPSVRIVLPDIGFNHSRRDTVAAPIERGLIASCGHSLSLISRMRLSG